MPAPNPFDQFDEPPAPATAPSVSGANPFDQFDPPEAQQAPQQSWGDAFKHLGGMAARQALNTVTALPLMAQDFGVGARNLYGMLSGGQSDFEYPSDIAHRAMDQYLGKPQGKAEKIEDALGPMLLSAASSGPNLPVAIRSMAAPTPMLGSTMGGMSGPAARVPPNFVTPSQAQAQQLAQALKEGQGAGYVVPPATTNPTIKNQLIEMGAGKIATQQGASVANQATTNRLAAQANGLNPDSPLTPEALQAVRKEAGQAYQSIRKAGTISTDNAFLSTLTDVADKAAGPAKSFPGTKPSPLLAETDALLVPSFDASHAVDKIDQLRDAGRVAWRAGDTGLSNGYRTLSNALESQMERALQAQAGQPGSAVSPDLVSKFKNARRTIAIAHATEDAMVPGSNDVSTGALATAVKNGDIPADSPLAVIGRFGNTFQKAAQSPAKIGSAGVNHLGGGLAAAGSLVGEHAFGPWGLVTGPAYLAGKGLAKSYALGWGQGGAAPKAAQSYAGPASAKASALAQALLARQRLTPEENK
jgi:hypothetical protein